MATLAPFPFRLFPMPHLIFYSKPGCHLCEGLQEKLEQLSHLPLEIEIRDITRNPEWFQQYQYEIPVLCRVVSGAESSPDGEGGDVEQALPRLSPRAPLRKLEQMIQTYLGPFEAE
ncbi:MAG: glutaredoxin family protein [Cyanobacteria bacterium P01_A01_bin.114]